MKRLLIAIVALSLFAVPALAETKIARVDMQKALNACDAGKDAKKQIDALVQKYEGDFKLKQDAITAMQKDLEKEAAVLSDSAKQEKAKEYQQKVIEITQLRKKIQDELKAKDKELTNKILEELYAELEVISKKKGYNLVLNEGVFMYADGSIEDLTQDVVDAHNAK